MQGPLQRYFFSWRIISQRNHENDVYSGGLYDSGGGSSLRRLILRFWAPIERDGADHFRCELERLSLNEALKFKIGRRVIFAAAFSHVRTGMTAPIASGGADFGAVFPLSLSPP